MATSSRSSTAAAAAWYFPAFRLTLYCSLALLRVTSSPAERRIVAAKSKCIRDPTPSSVGSASPRRPSPLYRQAAEGLSPPRVTAALDSGFDDFCFRTTKPREHEAFGLKLQEKVLYGRIKSVVGVASAVRPERWPRGARRGRRAAERALGIAAGSSAPGRDRRPAGDVDSVDAGRGAGGDDHRRAAVAEDARPRARDR